MGPFKAGGGNGVVGSEPVTLSGFGLGFGFGFVVCACPDELPSISTDAISIAMETNLLFVILTDLLVPVAITGDGPLLPHNPIRNWTQQLGSIRRRRIEAKRLRGAKQVAIIAKAVRLVLRNRMRPDFFATYVWRGYARCQTAIRGTHLVADHDAGAERVEARATTLRASYRGAGAGATDCTGRSGSAATVLDHRSTSLSRSGTGFHAACGCERGADAARISMHLFGAGNLDGMGGRRFVVQLCSGESVRARAVRELPAERQRAITVHSPRGNDGE